MTEKLTERLIVPITREMLEAVRQAAGYESMANFARRAILAAIAEQERKLTQEEK